MNNTNKKNKITITIKMIPIVVLKQKIQHLIKIIVLMMMIIATTILESKHIIIFSKPSTETEY